MFQRPVRLPCTLNPRSPPRARLPLILAAGRVRTSVPRQSHAARLCCARCGYLLLLSRRAAQLIVYYKRVCAPIRPKPLLLLVTDALPSSDPSVSRRCLCQGSSYRSLLGFPSCSRILTYRASYLADTGPTAVARQCASASTDARLFDELALPSSARYAFNTSSLCRTSFP